MTNWFDQAYLTFVSSSEDDLRKIVEEKAMEFIELLNDKILKNLAWELAEKNVQRVLKEKREFDPSESITIGTARILTCGFTSNQEYWLKNLDKRLKEREGRG